MNILFLRIQKNMNTLTNEQIQYYTNSFSKRQGRKYPCSNQTVTCGIISNKSEEEINKIMINRGYFLYKMTYQKNEWLPKNQKCYPYERWIHFKNLNLDSCRGYRFYKIIIDKNIDRKLFQLIILPYCSLYCCEMTFI